MNGGTIEDGIIAETFRAARSLGANEAVAFELACQCAADLLAGERPHAVVAHVQRITAPLRRPR